MEFTKDQANEMWSLLCLFVIGDCPDDTETPEYIDQTKCHTDDSECWYCWNGFISKFIDKTKKENGITRLTHGV